MAVLQTGLLLAASLLAASGGACAEGLRPNIVFILADDLGIRALGCYGSDYYRTPHRVHLTDALPGGRLPENQQLVRPDHVKELPAAQATYAQALRAAGYRTALIGKWHLGNEHAFFEQKGHAAYGFDEACDADNTLINKVNKAAEALTAEALHHHTPHVPLACPPEYEARYDSVAKGKNHTNHKYAGMVSHLDDSVQRLLPLLQQCGDFPARDLFWHLPHYREEGPQSAVLSGNWKLIHQIDPDRFELYDLEADPAESRDVATQYPDETARLRKRLEDHLLASGAQRMRPNPEWDPSRPAGRIRNFGVCYPKHGGTYVQAKDEPYPPWFLRTVDEKR